MKFLALILLCGRVFAADDFVAILESAKHGNVDAQMQAATRFYAQRDFRKAAEWYEKASKQGNAAASYELGIMYQLGMVKAKYPLEAAMVRIGNAAMLQGYAQAQRWMGWFYSEGCKDAILARQECPNYNSAMEWYRRAADQKDTQATVAIARFYEHGFGVKANTELAIKWYRKAADLGDSTAKVRLEILLEEKER